MSSDFDAAEDAGLGDRGVVVFAFESATVGVPVVTTGGLGLGQRMKMAKAQSEVTTTGTPTRKASEAAEQVGEQVGDEVVSDLPEILGRVHAADQAVATQVQKYASDDAWTELGAAGEVVDGAGLDGLDAADQRAQDGGDIRARLRTGDAGRKVVREDLLDIGYRSGIRHFAMLQGQSEHVEGDRPD